jgi:hypothetical protein
MQGSRQLVVLLPLAVIFTHKEIEVAYLLKRPISGTLE